MDTKVLLTGGVLLITAVTLGWVYMEKARREDPYQDSQLITRGTERPPLWIYLNSADVNARSWADFMGRSSKAMNMPFLNLCYQTIVKANGEHYRIEVIGGLQDLAVRLGGWEALPEPLRRADAPVREPELNWIRTAVLAKWGGLWVSPATIFLRPAAGLPDRVVFFGADSEPTFGIGSVPALTVIWSPKPEHPLFVAWEEVTRARLERRAGGSEFRHDEKTDTLNALDAFKEQVEAYPWAEVSRKGSAQRRVQLEDLLAAGTQGALPFEIRPEAAYLPIPYPELLEREAFGWFLRMSEDQILESDLAISHVLRAVLA